MSLDEFLRGLEQRLDVPYPERRQVVDEIAAHLEALVAEGRADGLDPDQAWRAAVRRMSLDHEFIEAMGEVHGSAVARALARLPAPIRRSVETLCIGFLGMAMVATVLMEEAKMVDFMLNGGIFMIPINLAGLALVYLLIERVYSLYVKRDHSRENLRRRQVSIRFLGVICFLTGVLGTLMGFYQAFSMGHRASIELPVYQVVSIALSTSIVGATYALIAALAGFAVEAKARAVEALQM